MPMTAEEFTRTSGVDGQLVSKLIDLGLLPASGALDEGDMPVARLLARLEASGVDPALLAQLLSDGDLTLDNIGRGFLHTARMQTGTLFELAEARGLSAEFAEDFTIALGVRDDGAGLVRDDDAALLGLLADMVQLGVPEAVVADLFRVMAESILKMTRAASEMWEAGVQQPLLDSGMSFRDIVAAQSLSGDRLQEIGVGVVSTVWRRFLDDQIFDGTVAIIEQALGEVGVAAPEDRGPPVIAFVDLTAFTALTDHGGDAVAAAGARDLRTVIQRRLVASGGRLVKMLGDGAMLYFPDASAAVVCALELVSAIPRAGLPQARVGMSAGHVIVRDVDYFGKTVNVAARLVDYARPGEVLATSELVEVLGGATEGVEFVEIGRITLKGIGEPVHVFSVVNGEGP